MLNLKKELIEREVITKDENLYSEILNNQKDLTNFFRNYFGWNLYTDKNIIRLEKIPSNSEDFMGNKNFYTKEDYCIYISFLMALETYPKDTGFKFVDIFNKMKSNLDKIIDISWEISSNRRAVKRVFEYAENRKFIINGATEKISVDKDNISEIKVFYKKTNYYSPKYILNIQNNIFDLKSFEDFKLKDKEESKINPKKTLFRKLISKPVVYFSELSLEEKELIKNRRVFEKFSEEIGGEIHINKNSIFLFFKEMQIGELYPKSKRNSEDIMILIINSALREKVRDKKIILNDDDTFILKKEELASLIEEYRIKLGAEIPNKIIEGDKSNLTDKIVSKMKEWFFLEEKGDELIFYSAVGKITGTYIEESDEETNEIKEIKLF